MKKERSKELFSPESCSPVLSGGIRDFTVHGTEPVPLHIYHQDYAHGGLSVPFHWHKELEWIWVEKGTLTLTLKTETRTISEGTFLFINSHELHQLCSIGIRQRLFPCGSTSPVWVCLKFRACLF